MLYTSILWLSCLIITPSYLKSEAQNLLSASSSTQEGFIADTIIKTTDGYKSIESLEIHDQVMGYDTDTQQYYPCHITAITKQCAPNSIKIITGNSVIQTGAYQKLYLTEKKDLILAKDIRSGDCLYGISGNSLIVNVENVDTSTTLYAITVEQNHFCITHSDVLVHNFDPCTTSTLLILAPAANPVGITILGGVILTGALCLTLHKILKSESNKTAIQFLNDGENTPSIDQDLLSGPATGGSPEPPEDPNNPRKEKKERDLKIYENNAKHIFAQREGHLVDTPENRNLLLDLVSDEANKIGCPDKHGNQWYAKTLPDGTQLWAWVRNGYLRDGGLNKVPRTFNIETGLCKPK